MMNPSQVRRVLDEEHHSNLDLLGQVEQAFGRARPDSDATAALMTRLAQSAEYDIERHFRFEEEELFPRMADSGDGAIAEMLREEHETIREVVESMLPLARRAAAGELDEAGWSELRRDALELVERQVAHIQKEGMALLPLLDDLLDPDTDRELAFAYAAG